MAEALAQELCQFPQGCLRSDRLSVYQQWDLPLAEAMLEEFEGGVRMLQAEGIEGAAQFAAGAGRHGSFEHSV
jgi:enoyl-CoA hydratase